MFQRLKFVIGTCILVGFASFLAISYSQHSEQLAVAGQFSGFTYEGSEPVCDWLIPIGEVTKETVDLIDEVFQAYQLNNLNLAIQHIEGIVTLLGEHKDVCDFSQCTPLVENKGFKKFGINLEAYFANKEFTLGDFPPWCNVKECIGSPCPLVSQYIIHKEAGGVMSLDGLKNTFRTSAEMIHDIFETTVTVTEDLSIEKDGSDIGQQITRIEAIKRKNKIIEEKWLSPSTGMNCMPSKRERELIKAGKLPQKYPMRCQEALGQGFYKRPVPWSEKCQDECTAGKGEDCVNCLAKCEGNSKLAKLNCRMYSKVPNDKCNNGKDFMCCGNVCEEGFGPECTDCLCRGLTKQECIAYLCGGSVNNWLCCHINPLAKE